MLCMSFLKASTSPRKNVFKSDRSLAISFFRAPVCFSVIASISGPESDSDAAMFSSSCIFCAPTKYERTSSFCLDFRLVAAMRLYAWFLCLLSPVIFMRF
ncbi:hypothetical protein FKM82_013114 [Ascaphus truei]